MGCFLACFGGSSKNQRRRELVDSNSGSVGGHKPIIGGQYKPVSSATVSIKQDVIEEPFCPISDSGNKCEEQSSLSNQVKPEEEELNLVTRKKVTFDSSVKTIERVSIDDVPRVLSGIQEEEEDKRNNENLTKLSHSPSMSESGSTLSSLGSYPPNYRYQNCRESDDDNEELDCEDSDLDDEDTEEDGYDKDVYDEYDDEFHVDAHVGQELSCRSFPSMEPRTISSASHMVNETVHDDEVKTVGLNYNARDRSGYIHSVLNPVENVTQWKAVKAKGAPRLKQQKENFTSLEEPRMSFSMDTTSPKKLSPKHKSTLDGAQNDPEEAVDASLSTWIVSSQKTPICKASMTGLETVLSETSASSHGSNSLTTREDRPILGALTVEELKQFSSSNATRWSATHSPDNMRMFSAAGTHWSGSTPVQDSGSTSSFKGLPNTTSKYREDKKVTWHSTPFETRLERALNKGAAVATSESDVC